MSNSKMTRRALLTSVMALVLCFAMLTGTTFAWFTDQETSGNNKIVAGNLDVELYYQAEGDTDWTNVTETTNVFMEDALWEPGHTEVVKLKVANVGNLALKYQLTVNVASETGSTNVNDVDFKLSDFIKFGIVDGAQSYTREQAVAAVEAIATALNTEYNTEVIALEPKDDSSGADENIVTMVVYMPTSVGNEVNHKKGAAVPTVNIGLNLIATQRASEEDSFDNKYDESATYPINIVANVSADSNNKSVDDVVLSYTSTASLPDVSGVKVTVPQGTLLEDGATELVFGINETDEVNADVATQITSDQTATTYEITLDGVAEGNDKDINVSLFIEKGLVDVKLYHKDVEIYCDYNGDTGELSFSTKGFSPFTVVSTVTELFEEGKGTAESPYIIKTAKDLLNISKYNAYKYYKVADGVETLDLNGIGNLSLYGSFDGNGVKIVNLSTALFKNVGRIDESKEIKISNMDVTVHTTDGRALVRNIYNPGETIFKNISMHGYIEGQYNMGSFYNYGTANSSDSQGADYTVSFVNAKSDVTLVCTTGNVMGGMLGHGYEGANYKLYVNMDENSGYTGKMYTTTGSDCYQVMAMCSHGTYVLNGVETSRYTNTYPSTKLTVVAPVAGENGYTVTPVTNVDHFIVFLNAQITAYDENGNKIDNLSGMTRNLGNTTVKENLDGKIFDLISSAKIVNGLDHKSGYEMTDGALTIYTGSSENYASGWITLQVNQYSAEGELLATGILTIHTFEDPNA